jgi:dihydrofolate reductase
MKISPNGARSSTTCEGVASPSEMVVTRSLKSVGPNATPVDRDVEAFVRSLKSGIHRNLAVAGPELAASLTKAGLIDEYHLYFRPVVLGDGKPYFAGARAAFRLVASDPVGDNAVRLTLRNRLIAQVETAVA